MKKDVMIGYPCYDGRAEVEAVQLIMQCAMSPDSPVAQAQMLNGDSLVTRARNKIAFHFLKSKCEYLLFIDSDILFTPADIARLRSHEKRIVGGVYFKKKLPYQAVANRHLGDEDGLMAMGEIGTGFIMIHRSVFEDMITKSPEITYKNESDEQDGQYYDFFQVGVHDGRYLSEDYFFCTMAAQLGIKSYLDPNTLVRHVGRAIYPFKDEDLLDGALDLIENWHPEMELDVVRFNKLKTAIERKLV